MANELENNDTNDEVSLKELILKIREWWRYLWSKKWIIISAGVIGGLLGFGYAYTKKPIYTATTTFVLESGDKGGGLGQYAGVASMMGIDLGGDGGGIFQGDNILELYKSRTMIEKTLFSSIDTISRKPLIEMYIEMNNLRDDWQKMPELARLRFDVKDLYKTAKYDKQSRLKDSIIGKVVEDINKNYLNVTKPDKKLSIIKVDVKAINESFAKCFNQELVKNVNDFYVQTKTKKSLENVIILQHKVDSVRAVMNGAIYNAAAVSDATPNLNPTRQVQRLVPLQRSQFSLETNKVILGEITKNLELSKIALLKETPLIQEIDIPIYPLLKTKSSKIICFVAGSVIVIIISCLLYLVKFKIQDVEK